VVLLNSNFWEDPAEKKKDRVRVADIAFRSKDLFVQEAIPGLFYRHDRKDPVIIHLIEEAKQMEPIGIAYASLAMRNRSDRWEVLKGSPEQFQIIQGENDPLIPAEKMNSELKDVHVRVEIFEHSGHMAHIEEPQRTLSVISNFLK
jgi:pimeloyl-ACP methyl ester carboxylesterase